jgi:hypothetical protein
MIRPLGGGCVLNDGANSSFNAFCASVTDVGRVVDGMGLAECKGPRTRRRPRNAFCCLESVYNSLFLIAYFNTHH